MIQGKTVLAIIPARGGSKGVPRKNIRDLAGKPLIAWTIEAAQKSKYIDRLILSSEDSEIIQVAKEWGCEVPFVRPVELAQDNTPGIEPVLHAIEVLPEKYDYVVLLQVTSPLRTVEDIDGCIEECEKRDVCSCISVVESDQSPYLMYSIDSERRMSPIIDSLFKNVRRQELPNVYVLNGAVYAAKSNWILREKEFVSSDSIAYVMPKERSIDIDTELDLLMVEFIRRKN